MGKGDYFGLVGGLWAVLTRHTLPATDNGRCSVRLHAFGGNGRMPKRAVPRWPRWILCDPPRDMALVFIATCTCTLACHATHAQATENSIP